MKYRISIERVLYAIIFIFVAYYSVGYFAANYTDKLYLDAFSGELFATLLGVVVGLPAALYVDRQASRRHEHELNASRLVQQHAQLSLIAEELEQAARDIQKRHDLNDIVLPPINTELWRTLQPSARIREVRDVRVVAKIGDAYNRVAAHQAFEMQYHTILHTINGGDAVEQAKKHFMIDLRNMDADTLGSITSAVKAIKHYIKANQDVN